VYTNQNSAVKLLSQTIYSGDNTMLANPILTNIWMWNGCLFVVSYCYLPHNILMENMFYIIRMC